MPRGKYTCINDIDRQRIVSAFIAGQYWITLAKELEVKRQSARNIVLSFQRSGRVNQLPRGGRRPSLMEEEMMHVVMYS